MMGQWEFLVGGTAIAFIAVYLVVNKLRSDDTPTSAPLPTKKTEEAPVKEKPKAPGGPLLIYFASQTGTAEGFAKTLRDQSYSNGFDARVVDLEDFDAEELKAAPAALFLIATYGEGEPTDNSVDFSKWLATPEDDLPRDYLTGLQCAVFGLGNRQYEHYNAMSKKVEEGLTALGASLLMPRGEGDDDGSLEDDFENWREQMWPVFRKAFVAEEEGGRVRAISGAAHPLPQFVFKAVTVVGEKSKVTPPGSSFDLSQTQTSCHHNFEAVDAKVVINRELRQDTSTGSTVHLELDIRNTGLDYCTADNLAVLPVNETETVEAAAAALGYDLDRWFTLQPLDEEAAASSSARLLFPQPLAVREALSRYCDLTHAPRKALLSHLAHFATDADECARLQLLSSKEGKAEYQEWVLDHHRSLLEVLQAFPSISLPLERFIELVPRLQPRYYTISSSPLKHPNRIHLTVSVIRSLKGGQGETQAGSHNRWLNGVCSTHLSGLKPPTGADGRRVDHEAGKSPPGGFGSRHAWSRARVFVRPSSFRLPQDAATPVIMVGPGTGLAPMRALLQHRQALRDQTKQQEQEQEHGDNILFFGCRNADQDFIYEQELLGYGAEGTLTQLHTAFSRERNTKVYVQHRLAEQGAQVWQLLDRGAYFYVCGGTSMGHDVLKAVQDIIQTHKGVSGEEAAALVKQMQADGRYVQELWSA